MSAAPKLRREGSGRASARGERGQSPPDPGMLKKKDQRRLRVPETLSPTNRKEYWDHRDARCGHADAFARAQALQSEMPVAELAEDWEAEPGAIVPVTPVEAFVRLFPDLPLSFARAPRWRVPSWRAPPESKRIELDEFIGPSVVVLGRTIEWMAERYFHSPEFALDVEVWNQRRWREAIEGWLKQPRKTGVPVGDDPVSAPRCLYVEEFRRRHDIKTDEARLTLKALGALLHWGYRRGLWPSDDPEASSWIDRAGLIERGVRDPYLEARWSVVQAAFAAEDAETIEAKIRDDDLARRKKRELIVKLVEAAQSVASDVRIEDLAPFPRRPLQPRDPDQLLSAHVRADRNLSKITFVSEDLLADFDAATASLAKKKRGANAWAGVFVKSLARAFARLTGEPPRPRQRRFVDFVDASYRSIRPDCGQLDWSHKVRETLNGATKPPSVRSP